MVVVRRVSDVSPEWAGLLRGGAMTDLPMTDLPMWVVYDHPTDYPEGFIARQHIVGIGGSQLTDRTMAGTLESIRTALSNIGLVCLTRSVRDDPKIVETWL